MDQISTLVNFFCYRNGTFWLDWSDGLMTVCATFDLTRHNGSVGLMLRISYSNTVCGQRVDRYNWHLRWFKTLGCIFYLLEMIGGLHVQYSGQMSMLSHMEHTLFTANTLRWGATHESV